MKYLTIISIAFFISGSLLFSCQSENDHKKIKEFIISQDIVKQFDIGEDWQIEINNFVDWAEIYDITISENILDTLREINLLISMREDYPQYFNYRGFNYKGEKLAYWDLDSIYHETLLFYSDTVYSYCSSAFKNNSLWLQDPKYLKFAKGKEYFDYPRNPPDLDEKNSFYILGEWTFTIGNTAYLMNFDKDSVIVSKYDDATVYFTGEYAFRDGDIYLSSIDDYNLRIVKVLPYNLEIITDQDTLYANRVKFGNNNGED